METEGASDVPARLISRLCVFCGSSRGARPEFEQAARDLGATLAVEGITLVYGGGRVGLMGVLADAVLENGGDAIGVIPHALDTKELAHEGLTEMHVVDSMHARKALMADLSDAFLALPGGLGTCDELFEIVTWAQLGLHTKPCGLLNVAGYYDKLIALLDHAVDEQFIKPQHRDLILVERGHRRLLERMRSYRPPVTEKWIRRENI
jgi:uncharacterized protein (TIGR00730 family)